MVIHWEGSKYGLLSVLWTSRKFWNAMPIWCKLLVHWIHRPASRAALTAGISRAVRMPMMATTTSNSTSEKPRRR